MKRNFILALFIFSVGSLAIACQRTERFLDRIEPPVKVINESQSRRDSGEVPVLNQEVPLREKVPISKEVLKTWLPETVGDYKRTQLISGHREDSGIVSVLADYQHQDSQELKVKVEILDGAGENGSILLKAAQERLKLDIEENKEGMETRVYLLDGLRVRESENKEQQFAEIEFVDQNRYLFQIKGFGISLSQLWEFSSKASFNQP
ncbi:hypothetical protein [Algoriphagus hitonicola]|uniref:Lipoprotein n=1 Tax=Algoriphagus hitonicola TaxID=435880 RepID=A0A1I2WP68_9BACT|nr:hypothetical protein [Algoriphagus hitonicola]SFH02487.1 hypothetical protein SAMN04487988_11387 [Algoriphagus hitonicola]